MEPKVSYTLVGLFVILLGGALLGAMLWLSQGDYHTVYDLYYAYMRESVSGLSVNALVKYRGVDVGQVKEIVLNPKNPEEVRLALEIARGTPLKEDTVAILSVQGLTGFAFVNLTGGSRESPLLQTKPGEPYPVIKTGPSLFVRLDEAISSLLTNLNRLTEDVHVLMDIENRAALKQILGDMANLTHTLATRSDLLDRGITSAVQTLENIAKVSTQISTQMPTILEHLGRSANVMQGMAQNVAHTSKEVGAMLSDNRQNIERFTRQALTETNLLVSELRQLTVSLQRLVRQLEQEPNSLIFGKQPLSPGPGE